MKALLAEHFLLRNLPAGDLSFSLCNNLANTPASGRQTVFLQGDEAASMMVVVEGRVRTLTEPPAKLLQTWSRSTRMINSPPITAKGLTPANKG